MITRYYRDVGDYFGGKLRQDAKALFHPIKRIVNV
jgi:hypothetical protein